MSIALVEGYVDNGGTNGWLINLSNSTGANLMIAIAGWYSGITADPTGFSDSYSDTYDSLTKKTTGTPTSVRIYHGNQASPTVGAGHSLTWTAASSYASGSFSAWSGANAGASVLDNESGATATGTNTVTLPSRTPSEDNCLVITALMFEDNSAGTVSVTTGGWTVLDAVAPWSSGVCEGLAVYYQIQTTATACAPVWNTTNNCDMAAAMAIFKGPGGGGGGGGTFPALRLPLLGVG